MFKTCLDCARKHLASAFVFLNEAHLGYPDHRWLAVGELNHAEIEVLDEFPELAGEIRQVRLVVMKSHAASRDADIFSLIRKTTHAAGEDNDLTVARENSKIYDPVNGKLPKEVEAYIDRHLAY